MGINGTNIAFIGCNTVSAPVSIDFNANTVKVGTNFIQSRKACDNYDQPYIDLLKKMSTFTSTANSTALIINFFDKENNTLFNISRNLTGNEKKTLVFTTKNEIKPVISTTVNNISQTKTTTATIIAPQANSYQSASQNVQTVVQTPTASIPVVQTPVLPQIVTLTNPTVQAKQTAQVNPTAQANLTVATSASQTPLNVQLIGKYNPTAIFSRALPTVIGQQIIFTITPTFISLTGTCSSYAYLYQI